MSNREIAMEYLRLFCGGDVHGIEPLLAPDLRFTGPLHAFGSAAEYLDSLRSDPPEQCDYRILSVTENQDSVAVFYEYAKPDLALQIAQLFRMRGGRIREILLVFDSRALA